MFTVVIPTRDRPHVLLRTLARLAGSLARVSPAPEVIVVDNASRLPLDKNSLEDALGSPLRLIRHESNLGAAARTTGVVAASFPWVVMLDDDSWITSTADVAAALQDAPPDAGAIAGEVFLQDEASGLHESGGLPEVFVGCGVALRKELYLTLGGYDPAFGYYAEEYDLAAKIIRAGLRITLDRRLRFVHEKVRAGRSQSAILRRLVRNNAWVIRRYAPQGEAGPWLRETVARYARIAAKESALTGYARGLAELTGTLATQPRSPLSRPQWDRFTGLAHARAALDHALSRRPFRTAACIRPGKNAHLVALALRERGIALSPDAASCDTLVVATLSPGPMLDAASWAHAHNPRARVILPWIHLQDDAAHPLHAAHPRAGAA